MKATIIGFEGEELTDKLKGNIIQLVQIAIEEHKVTDFYFGNPDSYSDWTEINEKPLWKNMIANSRQILDYIAQTIKDAKSKYDIYSTLIAASPNNKNFIENLYDEVIQGYYIYRESVEDENSLDCYDLRDKYMIENIDIVFWYSNKILAKTSNLMSLAESRQKRIVYLQDIMSEKKEMKNEVQG